MGISTKLLLILAAFAVVPAILFGGWTYTAARKSLLEARISQLSSIADLHRDRIDAFFAERTGDLEAAANLAELGSLLPTLSALSSQPPSDEARAATVAADHLLQLLQFDELYHDVMLLDAAGRVVYASDPDLVSQLGQPYPDTVLFSKARSALTYAQVTRHPLHAERFVVNAATPVVDRSGAFLGEIVFQIDLSLTHDIMLNTEGLGDTGEVVIARRDGDSALFLFPLRSNPNAALRQRVPLGTVNGAPIQKAVLAQDGAGLSTDYSGEPVLAAWRYLPQLGWGLVTKMDAAEAFLPAAQLLNLVVLVGSLLFALGLLAALLTARSITRPIRELQRRAEIVSRGESDQEGVFGRRDELGQLATAFTLMTRRLRDKAVLQERTAAELRQSHELLELKVQERTAELQQANAELAAANLAEQQARHILVEQSEILEAFFSHTQTGLAFLDRHYRFLRVNEAFAQARGVRGDELVGRSYPELFSTSLVGTFDQVVASKEPWSAHAWPFEFKDHPEWGETFWDLAVVPIVDDQNEVESLVLSQTDVSQRVRDLGEIERNQEMLRRAHDQLEVRVRERTADLEQINAQLEQQIADRRRAEAELARLVQQLEAVNRELSDFAHVVSHDLKAPLRAISSLASMLAQDYRDQLDDAGREKIALLVGRANRMYGLIEGILQYSKLGRTREEREDVDLNEVVAQAVDLLALPGHIQVAVENDLPILHCDRTRMLQVFQNLLGNAAKFMDKPQGRIRIGSTPENGGHRFFVEDNGPGIEQRHFERVFKIFQTLHPRDQVESTGIGLAIVKKIVETYEGRIWIESTPAAGARFLWTLRDGARAP